MYSPYPGLACAALLGLHTLYRHFELKVRPSSTKAVELSTLLGVVSGSAHRLDYKRKRPKHARRDVVDTMSRRSA